MLAAETDVLTQYDQLGQVLHHYQAIIPKSLDTGVIDTAARRLGLLHNGVLVFHAEPEMAVLMDYCIYNMPQEGLNAAARYMLRNPPPAGSDEDLVLHAMADARHALLSVTKAVPGVGVECYDLLRREELFIVNRAFSRTAPRGGVLASRVLSMPDFEMSTGADLPVHRRTLDAIVAVLNVLGRRLGANFNNVDDPRVAPELSTGIIRACLRSGAANWVAYTNSNGEVEGSPPLPFDLVDFEGHGGPNSRNRPCPCGSGLKYKRCCGQLKRW